MKKRLSASLVFFLCSLTVFGAEDKPEQIVKAKANEVVQATLKGDWNKVLDLTYPEVIRQGGGREKMLDTVKQATEQMTKKGFAFRSAKVSDPEQIVEGGDKRFAVVPMALEMKAPGGTLSIKSFLLGISSDKGKTWTFIDGAKANNLALKTIVADLPASLKLPEKEKPVFKPDAEEK